MSNFLALLGVAVLMYPDGLPAEGKSTFLAVLGISLVVDFIRAIGWAVDHG